MYDLSSPPNRALVGAGVRRRRACRARGDSEGAKIIGQGCHNNILQCARSETNVKCPIYEEYEPKPSALSLWTLCTSFKYEMCKIDLQLYLPHEILLCGGALEFEVDFPS